MDDFSYSYGMSFLKYKKLATPIRIILAAIIGIQFFGIYQFPPHFLYGAGILAIANLLSLAIEKAKLSTVEIAERKCPRCDRPMYSKIIKCDKCGIQEDTDEQKN